MTILRDENKQGSVIRFSAESRMGGAVSPVTQCAFMTNNDNLIIIYIKLRQIERYLIKFHQVWVYRQTEADGAARTLRASYLRRPEVWTFIHPVFCLTTGPKSPPKRFLHIVRSRASSFKWEYPFLSLRSSSSFLRLLPRLLATSNSPFIFPSITCFRSQFLRKMWPILLAFRFLISCRQIVSRLQVARLL